MSEVLANVIKLASHHSGVRIEKLSAESTLDQDIRISGEDIWEFSDALAQAYGEHVREWPWHRFAFLDEGLSPLFPFALLWQLLTWPARGQFCYPSPYERLELGHIAAVIEKGEWFDP